jgi:hypothetical protein
VLDRVLQKIGIGRDSAYLANVVKHFKGNRAASAGPT